MLDAPGAVPVPNWSCSSGPADRAQPRPARARQARFCAVSISATLATQVLLVVLVGIVGLSVAPANAAAVIGSSIPAYIVSRRWVWGRADRNGTLQHALVFGASAGAGLLLSSVAVAWVHAVWGSPFAASGANLGAFGVLWIGRFTVLDRMFDAAA